MEEQTPQSTEQVTEAQESSPPAATNVASEKQTATTEQKPASPKKDVAKPGPIWESWIFWICIAVWLWFFFNMRKQKKKQKERKDEVGGVKKGDKVITIGRVHGVIVSTTQNTITVKPDEKSNATLTFDKAAIYKVNPEKTPEDEEEAS